MKSLRKNFAKTWILLTNIFIVYHAAAAPYPGAANHCPVPEIRNNTKTWNKLDESTLQSTYAGCKRNYSEKHCPIIFIKHEDNRYSVICGKR